jgi:hypothetical protein
MLYDAFLGPRLRYLLQTSDSVTDDRSTLSSVTWGPPKIYAETSWDKRCLLPAGKRRISLQVSKWFNLCFVYIKKKRCGDCGAVKCWCRMRTHLSSALKKSTHCVGIRGVSWTKIPSSLARKRRKIKYVVWVFVWSTLHSVQNGN